MIVFHWLASRPWPLVPGLLIGWAVMWAVFHDYEPPETPR